MPRRASSGISRSRMIGVAAVVAGICIAAFLLVRILVGDFGGGGKSKRTAPTLDVAEYLENANSLRGNVYQVSGVVEEQLKWTAANGRLFSLDAGDDARGDATPLPIRVPQDFSKQNIDRGSEFRFIVEVGKDGLLIAQDVEKI